MTGLITIHSLPAVDLIAHRSCVSCHCGPSVEREPSAVLQVRLVVHNAWDQREREEGDLSTVWFAPYGEARN